MKDTEPAEEWHYQRVAKHLPLEGKDFTLTAKDWRFSYGTGLWAPLTFAPARGKPYLVKAVNVYNGDGISMNADDLDAMIDSWAARLATLTLKQVRALSTDDLSVSRPQTNAEIEKEWKRWKQQHDPDPAAREARQHKVLAAVDKRFPAFAKHVKKVYGLPVPRTLVALQALFESADGMARDVIRNAEIQPFGVLERLAPNGLARKVQKKRDERCHGRYYRDPPEFLPIAFGGDARLHYGLWYDVDDKLPPEVRANHASDTAECFFAGDAPVDALVRRENGKETFAGFAGFRKRYLQEILAWFAKEEQKLRRREAKQYAKVKRGRPLPGGPGVVADGEELIWADDNTLYVALREHPGEVARWIVIAKKRLQQGDARLALELGRAIHWIGGPDWKTQGKDLLVPAYEALGRKALAGIARAHYAQRDAPSVDALVPEKEDD